MTKPSAPPNQPLTAEVNVQCGLMSFGAFWVAMAAAITAPWNYTLIRFFIG